jgi:hypothetical protein
MIQIVNTLLLQRPWPGMFERFSIPREWSTLETRVYTNLLYYKSNYVILSGALALWLTISMWRIPFSILLIVLIATYILGARRAPIQVGLRTATQTETYLALVLITVTVLWLTGVMYVLISWAALSLALAVLHATVRPTNMNAKITKLGTDIKMSVGRGQRSTWEEDNVIAEMRTWADYFSAFRGTPRLRAVEMQSGTKRNTDAADVEDNLGAVAQPSALTPAYAMSHGDAQAGGSISSPFAYAGAADTAWQQASDGANQLGLHQRKNGNQGGSTEEGASKLPRPSHVRTE